MVEMQQQKLNIEFFKNTTGQFTSNYEVKIPDAGTFDVQYTMKGGVVSSMDLNQEKSFIRNQYFNKFRWKFEYQFTKR